MLADELDEGGFTPLSDLRATCLGLLPPVDFFADCPVLAIVESVCKLQKR